MSGQVDIRHIEELLRSGDTSLRDLHTIWEQRVPIPEPAWHGGGDAAGASICQIPWVQQDIELAPRFTNLALAKEEFLLVIDAARELLRLWQRASDADRIQLVRVRMNLAAALTRLGFTRAARGELEPCAAPDFHPPLGRKLRTDILRQLGDIMHEESLHTPDRASKLVAVRSALGFYEEALRIEPERVEVLVLASAAALTLGEGDPPLREEAHEFARRALRLANAREDDDGPRFTTSSARAAAHAILGQVEDAARCYGVLAQMAGSTTAALAEARFRARLLAEALGEPSELFTPAFPPLQLIVFAGHLPDRAGRPERFPQSAVDAARKALRTQLDAVDARIGLVSCSAGADILFIEELRARGGTVHIMLPWSQEEFRRTSLRPYEPPGEPPFWEPRFDAALAQAATVREIGQVYEPGSDVGWEYMNEVTAGIALHMARASRLDVQPMVFWDGNPGYGPGGTDSFHAFWSRHLGREPIHVRPPTVAGAPWRGAERRHRRCERPIMRQEVKSMLFADIVGYSKLTEKVIPEFVNSFLEHVSRLAAESANAPRSVSTWGDAIYAVFDTAGDAGRFALALTQMIREKEHLWVEKGLFWEEPGRDGAAPVRHPLTIRVGLHTGPVVMHYNPLVRQLGFTGSHVTRAARIEPITAPGEVFASEEFAAMAELGYAVERLGAADVDAVPSRGDQGFVCEYAGTMNLAKGYAGRHRIFRVLPLRHFDLEQLAREAHETYCAECLALGDAPGSRATLRPWDALAEDLRDASRAQVADIPNKLRFLGYELAPGPGVPPSEIVMTTDQIDMLAEREHERWVAERARRGWTHGPARDDARKLHPLIVPWESLEDADKEKDRIAVRAVPALVERSGYRVRKIR